MTGCVRGTRESLQRSIDMGLPAARMYHRARGHVCVCECLCVSVCVCVCVYETQTEKIPPNAGFANPL